MAKLNSLLTSTMAQTFFRCLGTITSQKSDDKSYDHELYWTHYGILMVSEKTGYFLHYSGLTFYFENSDHNIIGMPCPRGEIKDWEQAFCEMCHGAALRVITDPKHIPVIGKLKMMTEDSYLPAKRLMEAEKVQWITS